MPLSLHNANLRYLVEAITVSILEKFEINSSGIIASGNSWRIFSLKCFSSGPRNKTAL